MQRVHIYTNNKKGYSKNMEPIKVKYFDTEDEKVNRLVKTKKGDWIDVYASKDVFVPFQIGISENENIMPFKPTMIPLGFAMALPKGYEAYLLPRSSTFKTWGIMQTNSMGIIDNSYCGDNDMWCMPVVCVSPHDTYTDETGKKLIGTWIHKGDKIGQFRIQEKMPEITFEEVTILGNEDRGGFGSTGTK